MDISGIKPTSPEVSFLEATLNERKRTSFNDDRRRRDIGLGLLKKRQKVTIMLGNLQFRSELEEILKGQLAGGQPEHSKPRQFYLTDHDADVMPGKSSRRRSQFSGVAGGGAANIIPINDLRGVNASKYTVAERLLRCKLASLYRLVDWFGWGHIIYNHITVKISKDKDQFLINPFGLMYSEVTASSLVKVNLAGNILDPGSTQLGCNKAGYMLHSAIHEGRPEIQCIIHLHTGPGTAVSAMSCGLLPISQEALIVGDVSYHDYRGIVVDEEEKQEIIEDLGPTNKVLILRNHGLVALGSTVEEAFHYLFNLMRACEVQVQALSCGIANLLQVSQDVCGQVQNVVRKGGGGVSSCKRWGVGNLEFEALMRMLDNLGYNTGYPYKGMELLQPPEDTSNESAKQYHNSEKKTRKSDKQSIPTKVTRFQSDVSSVLDQEVSLHKLSSEVSTDVTDYPVKENKLPDVSVIKPTARQEQKSTTSVNVHSLDSTPAIDNAWEFLSDKSPHEQITVVSSDQTHETLHNNSNGLWSFLDGDTGSPEMPAHVANISGGSHCSSSVGNLESVSQYSSEVERSSGVSVEQTARRVADSTSEAVRTLANRTKPGIKSVTIKDTRSSIEEVDSFTVDRSSPEVASENFLPENLTGLQKVMATAERVAASTSGAVLKLGSSLHHQ